MGTKPFPHPPPTTQGRAPVQRHISTRNGQWRWGSLFAAAGLAGLILFGCNHLTWEDMTSRDFKFQDFYTKPLPPLVVLQESKDGNKRGNAYRELKEPKENGGTAEDQNTILTIVATGAKTEVSYYARIQAMRKLGEFKDPRGAGPDRFLLCRGVAVPQRRPRAIGTAD